MPSYFAYGSNLHPLRLKQRLHNSKLVSIATLQEYRLCFHKRSQDGSAKCDAFFTGSTSDCVLGALFEITAEEKLVLDDIEGMGYESRDIDVSVNKTIVQAYAYVATQCHIEPDLKPFHWYKALVELGAKYHSLPTDYIRNIQGVDSTPDPNHRRNTSNHLLVNAMLAG